MVAGKQSTGQPRAELPSAWQVIQEKKIGQKDCRNGLGVKSTYSSFRGLEFGPGPTRVWWVITAHNATSRVLVPSSHLYGHLHSCAHMPTHVADSNEKSLGRPAALTPVEFATVQGVYQVWRKNFLERGTRKRKHLSPGSQTPVHLTSADTRFSSCESRAMCPYSVADFVHTNLSA